MMTVARYWEIISNKTKILFGVLAKRTITMYSWEWQYLQNKLWSKWKICLRAWKIEQRKLLLYNEMRAWITRWYITYFQPMHSFILTLWKAHQWLCSMYFAAVFIGVFRSLSNILHEAFCENSYEEKLYYSWNSMVFR